MNDIIKILTELNRRVAALERADAQKITRGRVAELDAAAARVRVEVAPGVRTPLLPWLVPAACAERASWSAPRVGEHVLVLCPGEFCTGVVLRGLYSEESPAPSAEAAVHAETFSDGASISYDTAAHRLTVKLPFSGASAEIYAAGDVAVECANASVSAQRVKIDAAETEITGNATVGGELAVGGNITGGGLITDGAGKVLSLHVHGNGNDGQPTTPPM